MEHQELVTAVGRQLGDERLGEVAVNTFRDAVSAALARGEPVRISGFGQFEARGAGSGGTQHVVRFRPGASFRRAVNGTVADPVHESALVFRRFPLPPGTSLSAVIAPTDPRCGIYRLEFDDGYEYVGQARNVVSRFATHRRRWGDRIVAVAFAHAPVADLDHLERQTIQHREASGTRLHNSALVGLPMGESPLDIEVDRVEQEQWLSGEGVGHWRVPRSRLQVAKARDEGSEKFRELSAHRAFDALRFVCALYIALVVPDPAATEQRFWSLTALPSTNRNRGQRRLCTLSINNVEVLVIEECPLEEGGGRAFINVAPDLVDHDEWPSVRHAYRTTGFTDAVLLNSPEAAAEFLFDERCLVAARRFALGLMRKGHGMLARHHDAALTDSVLLKIEEVGAGLVAD